MKTTTDALAIIDDLIADDPEIRSGIAQEALNQQLARLIYAARTKAALTQTALAHRVGTSQSVIARLENADYSGHSLTMLRRIADALDMQVDVVLKPKQEAERRAFFEPSLTNNIKFVTQHVSINTEDYETIGSSSQDRGTWTQNLSKYLPVQGGSC